MLVAVLIGIMISIVVGVSLVPVILNTCSVISTSYVATYPGVVALINVLPYVFVAVILLGAVAWIGGQG